MSSLFEVVVKNRVVKDRVAKGRLEQKRIAGTQGNWYPESLFFLADSETEAKKIALEKLETRRILGVSRRRSFRRNITREIKILDVRRITQ